MESRASAATHTQRPRLIAVTAAALGPPPLGWPSPRTPRPAGRCPPAGTSGAYPAPAAAAIKSGCFAWNSLLAGVAEGRLPSEARGGSPLPRPPDGAPNRLPTGRARGVGVGRGSPGAGAAVARTERASLSLLIG